jgi:small neutral amino acid transporter SnatA (MarC family)
VTEFLRIAATLFVAISPAAAAVAAANAPAQPGSRVVVLGAAVAAAAYIAAALGAGWLLDAVDIEPETFRVSAGLVMAVGGLFAVWTGGAGHAADWEGRWMALFPLALPLLVSPAGLAATISHSADGDTGMAIGAAAIAVALAAGALLARLGRFRAPADGVVRVSGALLVVFAGAMIVDGVRAV